MATGVDALVFTLASYNLVGYNLKHNIQTSGGEGFSTNEVRAMTTMSGRSNWSKAININDDGYTLSMWANVDRQNRAQRTINNLLKNFTQSQVNTFDANDVTKMVDYINAELASNPYTAGMGITVYKEMAMIGSEKDYLSNGRESDDKQVGWAFEMNGVKSFYSNEMVEGSNTNGSPSWLIINQDNKPVFMKPESAEGVSYLLKPGHVRWLAIDGLATQLHKDKVFKVSSTVFSNVLITVKTGGYVDVNGTEGAWKTKEEIGDINGANANWFNLFQSAETGTFNTTNWYNKPEWWGK